MYSEYGPNNPTKSQVAAKFTLGRAIATLYLAAQHTSETASTAACDLLEELRDPTVNLGFNQVLSSTGYRVRAYTDASTLVES